MSDYFDFKTFRICQQHSHAKVGTDAVILGAWFQAGQNKDFLEIGSGTGVIALLAATRFPHLNVVAIEPDEHNALDASFNFQQSMGTHRIQLFKMNLKEFVASNNKRFDTIVCNPPYHTEKVFAEDPSRSQWRSEIHLPFEELFQGVTKLLLGNGTFNLIAPFGSLKKITSIAIQNNFYLHRYCIISSFSDEKPIRFMAEFGFDYKVITKNQIYIYDDHNIYSKDYISLVGKYLK